MTGMSKSVNERPEGHFVKKECTIPQILNTNTIGTIFDAEASDLGKGVSNPLSTNQMHGLLLCICS